MPKLLHLCQMVLYCPQKAVPAGHRTNRQTEGTEEMASCERFSEFRYQLTSAMIGEAKRQINGGAPGDNLWCDWDGNLFWMPAATLWPRQAAVLVLVGVDLADLAGGEWIDRPSDGHRVIRLLPGAARWGTGDVDDEQSAVWAVLDWCTSNLSGIARDALDELNRILPNQLVLEAEIMPAVAHR